jgi:hypothetical protein
MESRLARSTKPEETAPDQSSSPPSPAIAMFPVETQLTPKILIGEKTFVAASREITPRLQSSSAKEF